MKIFLLERVLLCHLKNVTSDVQDQINTCLKVQKGVVHLTKDVTLTGSHTLKNITTLDKFAGVTPNELHCLSGVHTKIHQYTAPVQYD